ncbi:MAG: ATP-binding cassette domain-containing protein [Aerococcaceae bacterium]|nr:ATP-binding cassette domain-containing protein [Aerococcaceae bacterium]
MFELKDVTKYFYRQNGEQTLGLDNINLTIQQGEIVSIIGTNGAGKSTLLNCLAGQLAIDSGHILCNGVRLDALKPRDYAAKVARIFQDARLGTAPRMTVFENLMLAAKRGEKRGFTHSLTRHNQQTMQQKLAFFQLDLEQRIDVPMENLSGGQRQAVALLMATLKRPELLLLDEHTASLDPRTAKQVMALTHQVIRDHQLTAVMITHQLHDALMYSDRIIAMHRGRIAHVFDKKMLETLTTADLLQTLEQLVESE